MSVLPGELEVPCNLAHQETRRVSLERADVAVHRPGLAGLPQPAAAVLPGSLSSSHLLDSAPSSSPSAPSALPRGSYQLSSVSAPFLAHLATAASPPTLEPIVLSGSLANLPDVPLHALLDSGAGLDAVSESFVRAHGLLHRPLPRLAQAHLPNAVTLPMSHFVELPVLFDGRFKFVLRAFCLPLQGVDVIFGMPWHARHDAVLHTRQRRVEINYDGNLCSLSSRSLQPALRHGSIGPHRAKPAALLNKHPLPVGVGRTGGRRFRIRHRMPAKRGTGAQKAPEGSHVRDHFH